MPFLNAPDNLVGVFAAVEVADVHPDTFGAQRFDNGVEFAHIDMRQLDPFAGGLTSGSFSKFVGRWLWDSLT